jgi:uncharacterized membrane protein (UPF0127 family)
MSRRAMVFVTLFVVGLVALAVVIKVVDDDSDSTSAPSAPSAVTGSFAAALSTATPAAAPFAGLTEVKGAIGDTCLRLVVADSLDERVAGLRGNSADLGPYDGMVFVFPASSQVGFTMAGVKDPLDIAFFDRDGVRTSTREMKPCPDKAETECPAYRADEPFVYALETKPGRLPTGPLTACSST